MQKKMLEYSLKICFRRCSVSLGSPGWIPGSSKRLAKRKKEKRSNFKNCVHIKYTKNMGIFKTISYFLLFKSPLITAKDLRLSFFTSGDESMSTKNLKKFFKFVCVQRT